MTKDLLYKFLAANLAKYKGKLSQLKAVSREQLLFAAAEHIVDTRLVALEDGANWLTLKLSRKSVTPKEN